MPKMNFCFGHEYPCPLDLCCTQPQGGREINPRPLGKDVAQTFMKSSSVQDKFFFIFVFVSLYYAWAAPRPLVRPPARLPIAWLLLVVARKENAYNSPGWQPR